MKTTDRNFKMIDDKMTDCKDHDRERDSRMTEQDANKLAAAINAALRETGNLHNAYKHIDGIDDGMGLEAVAHPVSTGQTQGVIQIVDDSRWFVMVVKPDGRYLADKVWTLISDMEVVALGRQIYHTNNITPVYNCDAAFGQWFGEWF